MTTKCSDALCQQLRDLGDSPDEWADYFQEWKNRGPSGEYTDYFFGKDSAYHSPKIASPDGKLMHVHLVPILDEDALKKWDKDWGRRTRKRSNRALVYADSGSGDYLLIFVLNEPDAHAIAEMQTQEHAETMEFFAKVADAFIFDRSIVG